MALPELFNLLAQIATAIGVFVAAASFRASVLISHRQMNVQVFTTYTDRYEKIMSELPEDALRARFDICKELPPESEQLSSCMLRYLNMCSEEFYLWNKKYVDQKLWEIWEEEIRRMLMTDLMRREWPRIKNEFDSYPEFVAWVESVWEKAEADNPPIEQETASNCKPQQKAPVRPRG